MSKFNEWLELVKNSEGAEAEDAMESAILIRDTLACANAIIEDEFPGVTPTAKVDAALRVCDIILEQWSGRISERKRDEREREREERERLHQQRMEEIAGRAMAPTA
jgi:hypothetical protein